MNKKWMKIIGNIVLILTLYTLLQGILASGFWVYNKLRNKFIGINNNKTCITEIGEKISELELRVEKNEKAAKYFKGKAFGFEKIMRKEMEEPIKKVKRKRIIGIF